MEKFLESGISGKAGESGVFDQAFFYALPDYFFSPGKICAQREVVLQPLIQQGEIGISVQL